MKQILTLASILALRMACQADTAYGDLNNFDVVNDTGGKCYGFEIELDGVRSTEITYTYDWNHFGAPLITEDKTDPAHPKVKVRYQSKKNPDGTFASFTNPQDPANPIGPTGGHACTDPSVNHGCEHFGVGYYGAPSAVRYHWLVGDPASPGTLATGPIVSISTPQFVYYPPVPPPVLPGDPPAAPAVLQMVIPPPEQEDVDPDQFGVPVWVKMYKTVQPHGKKVKLDELVSDDPEDPNDPNWAGDEAPETEIEWMVFQARPVNNPGADEFEANDVLPEGDETVTRRYEFYVYNGPTNLEDGEADCDNPDNCEGAVGPYIGAQMAGFNVESPLGLIDHVQDGDVLVAFVDRTVVVGGNTPYEVSVSAGALPNGLAIDPVTGVLSGTPSEAGVFHFTVDAKDADAVTVSKAYTMTIVAALEVQTTVLPKGQEKAAYATTLTAEGGAEPYSWTSDPLPSGLNLDASGLLAGTPVVGTAGSHLVNFTVTDGGGRTATVALTLTLDAAPKPPLVRGDVDGDADVDRNDLNLIVAARNKPASGPRDPRDLDGDGMITVRDARIVVTLFTRPGGAVR